MKLYFNDLLFRISYALDCVEHDLLGVTTQHGQRVACICMNMGKGIGMNDEQLLDLTACAILHDNALTEYIHQEWKMNNDASKLGNGMSMELGGHCIMGERNISVMPFTTNITGNVLYHHENADGTGPFRKKASETPLPAQFIHLGDQVDLRWDLSYMNPAKYYKIKEYLEENRDKIFSSECIDLFMDNCSEEFLEQLNREKPVVILEESLPVQEREYSSKEVHDICTIFAHIIDYKSKFTRTHSIGIAEKAEIMGRFYHYSDDDLDDIYMAGALHDIGKLVVDRDILEKPGKLTENEYKHIQNHAYYTYDILRRVRGLEKITMWASLHHEKLNGKGYPFGYTADQLNQPERLMGCLDIYQALTEKRPYKDGMEHDGAIEIMKDMAENGFIDEGIVNDIDKVFGDR